MLHSAIVNRMSATLDTLLSHYSERHQGRRAEVVQCICIPAVLFGAIGLIQALSLGLVLISIAVAAIYYYRLDAAVALKMAVVMIFMLVAWVTLLPEHGAAWLAILFVLFGWLGVFIGHHLDGRRSSFFEDLRYVMIGPLFVLSVLGGTRPASGDSSAP